VLFYDESEGVVNSGHVTKMAVTSIDPQFPKTPCYMQTSRLLSFIESELLPIEVLHCGNREFRVFLYILEIIKKFCSQTKKDITVAETRLLSHKTRKLVERCDLYRCARNQKVTGCKKIDKDDDNFTHTYNRPP